MPDDAKPKPQFCPKCKRELVPVARSVSTNVFRTTFVRKSMGCTACHIIVQLQKWYGPWKTT